MSSIDIGSAALIMGQYLPNGWSFEMVAKRATGVKSSGRPVMRLTGPGDNVLWAAADSAEVLEAGMKEMFDQGLLKAEATALEDRQASNGDGLGDGEG
jgi:hypothetical protein